MVDFVKVGDRVAVVRKDSGVLHFFVNGEDQGVAASNVPERVYGVIDLYGQAAQVQIIHVRPSYIFTGLPRKDNKSMTTLNSINIPIRWLDFVFCLEQNLIMLKFLI